MKKVMMIGLVAALLAAACGGTSEGDPGMVADGTEAAADNDATANNEAEQSSAGDGEGGSGIVESDDAPDAPDTPDTEGDVMEEKNPDPSATDNPPSSGAADEEPSQPAIAHPNAQVATAMTDLVNRIGASSAAIEVVSVEEVTWSDGSIGCPQPGMRYTQAIVNGTRIVLRVSGADYEYHSGGSREVFYCENPSDPVPGGDYGDV